jgi:hypothetical protein
MTELLLQNRFRRRKFTQSYQLQRARRFSFYLAFVEAEEISISDAKEDDVLLKEMVN